MTLHVKLTDGSDGPETHPALNDSPIETVFLPSTPGPPYIVITGSDCGSSATTKFAVLLSVWNNGASADTSH